MRLGVPFHAMHSFFHQQCSQMGQEGQGWTANWLSMQAEEELINMLRAYVNVGLSTIHTGL